jgi:protein TonB
MDDTLPRYTETLEKDSFLMSVLLHLIVLLIGLWYIPIIRTSEQKIRIPIEMVLVEEPRPAPAVSEPTPKPAPEPAKKPQPSPTQQLPKQLPVATESQVPTQPQVFAGDRESPSLDFPVRPVYPKSALNFGWSGTVVVDFIVNPEGRVIKYKVIKSSGHEELDLSFIRYMQTQTLKPKRVQGQDVEGSIRMSHDFIIE